ncbi:methylated-DNA--[protein]-cysteine S-methyltransferase [Acuticoccus sp. MNP-M23]|uniref:methylated-DNA--[protein]-cysteine S-methyltransferase n=1 Tax=Acuticoccus sp. MNP-M23 TaxID=3072793 RepID=UPI002814EAA9|nr:methylated-DNA--[protein]-cysteine S-methyltransferase [Acuticoccus sp. MNP-M23]WMS43411.1 methylated-DNA--[protein]-cysteine S-methyltransferase [Acuticoccus sp. MNP-M23]
MQLCRAACPSPIGPLTVITDGEDNLCALDFDGYDERLHRLLVRYHGAALTVAETPVPRAIAKALDAYFAGAMDALQALPVRTNGSAFQERVWTALRTIGPGETLSYGALAARIGSAKASRAVGLANGANPVAIAVPCHRVIGADGSLTGFGGGIERKRWLLAHEAAHSGLFAAIA